MKSYKIISNGIDMGIYQADDERDAILAYVADAGMACGLNIDDFVDQIVVEEVK